MHVREFAFASVSYTLLASSALHHADNNSWLRLASGNGKLMP